MTEQRRGGSQGRPPAKRSGAAGGAAAVSGRAHGRVRRAKRSGGVGWQDRAVGLGAARSVSGSAVRDACRRPKGAKGGDRRDQGTRGGRGESARRRHGWGLRALCRRPARRGDQGASGAPSVPTTADRARARGSARRCGPSASAPSATRSRGARRRGQPSAPTRRRRKRGPADVQQEMAKVAGRNANRALGTLMAAADAFAHDRERETLRILRPLREQLPDSPERPRAHRARAVPARQLRRRGARSSRPTPT